MRKLIYSLLAISLVAGIASADSSTSCDRPAEPLQRKHLFIRGSTTLRPIMNRALAGFAIEHPDITVTMDNLGSSAGIRQLIESYCLEKGISPALCDMKGDGLLGGYPACGPWEGLGDCRYEHVDIAVASRPMKSSEVAAAESVGMCAVETVVARDGLGIVTNIMSNGPGELITGLTAANIQFIYENDMNTACAGPCTWAGLGLGTSPATIVPVSRTTEGGTFGSFIELYGVNEAALLANPSVVFVGSNDEISAFVENNPGAVGYVGISFTSPTLYEVPVAKNPGDPKIAASYATVQNGTFPFSRTLQAYTNGIPPAGDPRAEFLEYLQSRLGQAAVQDVGFVPVISLTPQADATQYLFEDQFGKMAPNSLDRVRELLDGIAEAQAELDVDPGNGPATTFKTESQFAIEEIFQGNGRVVQNLRDRLADRIGNGECPGKAGAWLAKADASLAAAADAVSGCSPIFPVTCAAADYTAWFSSEESAYQEARLGEKSCSTSYDPAHPRVQHLH